MAEWFSVTTASGAIDLDAGRSGAASFSVTNVSGAALRGRALPVADPPAQADWFTIAGGAERSFPAGGTERYEVDVTATPTTPPGAYRFRLDVLGTDNPDEVQAHGQWVSFQVPAPPKAQPRRVPWPWIAAVAAAVVVLAAGVTAWALTHREPTPGPVPRPGPLSLSSGAEDFHTVRIGASGTRTVTVRNTGRAATAVTAAIAGEGGPFTLQDDGCRRAGRLQPNAGCTLTVRFAPVERAPATASLQVSGDGPDSRSVALTGTGVAPVASAPVLRMKRFSLGGTTGTAVVTNEGDADLHVKQVGLPSGFSVVRDACSGRAVPPKHTCAIDLRTSVGATPAGWLTIVSDSVDSPLTVPISS
jgi:hypothetical protein